MHIFLLILKIIGIVLGSILGLLLALLLVILFVPIHYQINAEQQGKFQCQIKGNWLLKFISYSCEYAGERFIYRLKILGITVKSNLPKRVKKAKQKKSNTNKVSRKKKQKDKLQQKKNSVHTDKNEEKKQNTVEETIENENFSDSHKNLYQKHEPVEIEKDVKLELNGQELENEFTFFEKASCIFNDKYQKFLKKIQGIKKKIKNMIVSIRGSISRIKIIWAFLTEEENKTGFHTCMKAVKKIVKHIKPKKLKGYLKFGTGDPCSSGQILGVIAVFYGKYGKFFQIIPDFEEKVLEYTIYAKGKVRIFTIGKIALQLWFSKELKKLIENFEHCKEELENGR